MSGLSVVLAGGGTAGHVSPMLALADALLRDDPTTRIVCLGTVEGLESRLVPQRGYRLATIPKVPLPRRVSPELALVPGRLASAVRAAGRVIDDARADVVVGMGGYVATPAYLAARQRGVPIVVHEQNARAGLANKVGAPPKAALQSWIESAIGISPPLAAIRRRALPSGPPGIFADGKWGRWLTCPILLPRRPARGSPAA